LKLKKRRETARISQRFTLADVECKSLGSRSSFHSSSSFEKISKISPSPSMNQYPSSWANAYASTVTNV